jgi:hypothetical protein
VLQAVLDFIQSSVETRNKEVLLERERHERNLAHEQQLRLAAESREHAENTAAAEARRAKEVAQRSERRTRLFSYVLAACVKSRKTPGLGNVLKIKCIHGDGHAEEAGKTGGALVWRRVA